MATYRITNNGMFYKYRNNLTRINSNLQKTMGQVVDGRKFDTFAENPADASRAFQLRRSFWRNNNSIETSNYLISKFETAYEAAGAVIDGDSENPGLDSLDSVLRGMTDTAGSGRVAYGYELAERSDSIAMMLNSRYGDEYVFAGSDGMNAPFEWRTIKVDMTDAGSFASREEALQALEDLNANTEETTYVNGYRVDVSRAVVEKNGAYTIEQSGSYRALYYRGVDINDAERIDTLIEGDPLVLDDGDITFANIGLGMRRSEQDDLVATTAFKSSISGAEFVGYGVDEDGDSKNLAVLISEIGAIFTRCDSDNGEFASEEDRARLNRLSGKLSSSISRMQEQHGALSARSEYLKTNLKQLEDSNYNLNEEIADLEDVDPVEAITHMEWAMYTYQAALRIGTNLLSNTLFDYMS